MKYRTGNEVRALFLNYFKNKGHMIEPGASLIPQNDPTLLWINAGVAALKKYFDGTLKTKNNRIANAQKSIRTNDIENVGKTARHHTFFEMLGNFSIGDYFKKDAINFAWEFLTSPDYIGFDKNRLYISVFTDDQEAYDIWVNDCHVDPAHILHNPDNFWEIGEGPCGPNTEIFYDRGRAYDEKGIGDKLFFDDLENDRYIEVWNVVFSQFDAKEGKQRSEYTELPQKNIDTGMGLERLVCLIQEGETNFDTDLFMPIIKACEKFSNYSYDDQAYKMPYRVIADHIRTVCFALADGALFSNEGRGYVLRRVLRRAVRFGKQLNIQGAFMYKLVDEVYECMKEFYPYLGSKIAQISKLVKIEEERFHTTLNDGEKLLEELLVKNKATKKIDGKSAFKLYDTYGFPVELTIEIAMDKGYEINIKEFQIEMGLQKQRARAARAGGSESMKSQSKDLLSFNNPSTFIGYDQFKCISKVIGLFKDGNMVDELYDFGEIIVDKSVFYAESGGQVSDHGYVSNQNFSAEVTGVRKAPNKQHLHFIENVEGTVKVGDVVEMLINVNERQRITANHSCTHLLQSALKQIIGEHIQQAGSYVSDSYFRFDFTHFEKISHEQMGEIEQLINTYIADNHPVNKNEMPIEEAKQSGATALFDEKYGDVVRVVSMGDVSKEFCGGCHVNATQEIGVCHLTSEESIGSGIRRICGTCGINAYFLFANMNEQLYEIANCLKITSVEQISKKIEQQVHEIELLRKESAEDKKSLAVFNAKSLESINIDQGRIKLYCKIFNNYEVTILRDMAEALISDEDVQLVFFINVDQDKINFVARASKKAVMAGINCGSIVKNAATLCGGNGGGRPDFAQAGGKDASKIDTVIENVKNMRL